MFFRNIGSRLEILITYPSLYFSMKYVFVFTFETASLNLSWFLFLNY
ncbi:hypothetical protein Pf1_01655 [Flavobacterium columnare]|nr:hypothetical protein Pf1_01655 [Flavobacterium columnare]